MVIMLAHYKHQQNFCPGRPIPFSLENQEMERNLGFETEFPVSTSILEI